MNDKYFCIEEELKKLPQSPGVYLMYDNKEIVIYVGKAISLKNRVRQYFQSGRGHNRSPKIEKMVSLISHFEYIVTNSEMEALVLEANLIKEYRPKYNTMLTDDKGYPYIKITTEEAFPRLFYSHTMKRDKAKYFGPYTNIRAVKDTIELLTTLYNLRRCNRKLPQDIGKERPCMYYQIHKCKAPCNGYISSVEYKANVQKAISFLNGDYKQAIKELEYEMKKNSDEMEFEKAAKIRDLINGIKHIVSKQRVSDGGVDDKDIIAMAYDENDTVVSVFFIREGKLIGREHFHMNSNNKESEEEVIASFMKQYYCGTPYLPKEIIIQNNINDKEILEDYLTSRKGQKVKITVPQKGDKNKLLDLAKENASLVLAQDIERIKRKEERTVGAANELATILGIESARRLEAFDISNISGYHSVASMVVFENGKPKKNAYRKFKLQTVSGPDDYASMKEVLTRRFTDPKLDVYPDVVMIDGGKGQVNIAHQVLDSLGIDIKVCGMVKDDNHRTRGLYYNNSEVNFNKGSQALNMITALQDEAHRFAIEYHKLLRSKDQVKSILDDIKGVGPQKRKQLMIYFKDINIIKTASVDELMQVKGINEAVAIAIRTFFNGEAREDDI